MPVSELLAVDDREPRVAADALDRQFGPYRVRSILGQGAMGVVYRAEHVQSGERVALKVSRFLSEAALDGIRREIHALKQLSHPGIVRVVDDGTDAGLPWFAMELLVGATARVVIDDLHAPSGPAVGDRLESALLFVARLCEPLAYLHERGIVHADLKPENVHVRADGLPVLVDFGLFARYCGSSGREVLQVAGSLTGTVSYMAPEQIRGELVDARADIYALGCIAYEAIAGVPPFSSDDTRQILLSHLFAQPKPLSLRVPGVPPWVDELVLGLLSKTRRERLGYADVIARRIAAELGVAVGAAPSFVPRSYLYRPELVGRDEVLAAVAGGIDAARQRRGMLVFVHGETGIGKTRLAIEIGSVAVERGMRVILGECIALASEREDAPRTGTALQPFRALLSVVADRCRQGGRTETDRLLGARGPVLACFEPSLATLPGQKEYPPPAEMSPEAAMERLQRAMLETLRALATPEEPLLLVLDDLQWADEPSLAVLAALARAGLDGSAILVVGTYRSEEAPDALRSIVESAGSRVFRLDRLDGEGIRRIVGDMLALRDAPPDFVGALFGQAEGNPFFVSEYLHAAVDEGLLLRDTAGRWAIARRAAGAEPGYALPIPRSLDALIRHRLAALDSVARRTLELASVLGQSFEETLLMSATTSAPAAAMESVDLLLRRELVQRSDGALAFSHGKIREITYQGLPPAERAALHERAARCIEARCRDAETLTRHSAGLAHHWARAASVPDASADVVASALDALGRAGEYAVRADANHDAVRIFEDALRLLGRAPARGSPVNDRHVLWEHQLGEAYYRLGNAAEARRHLETALGLMGERLPRRRLALAWRVSTAATRQVAHRVTKRRLVRAAAARERHTYTVARAYELLSFVQMLMMDRSQALVSNLRALNLAERVGRPSPVLANSMALFGVFTGMLVGPRMARPYLQRALETARVLDDDYCLGRVAHMVAFHCLGQALWDEAERACDEALGAFERVRDGRWRETAVLTMGNVLHLRGDPASVEKYHAAGAASRERGDLQSQAWSAAGLADAYLMRGAIADALAQLETFEDVLGGDVARLADRTTEFSIHGIRAAAFLRSGRNEEADREVHAALFTAQRSPLLLYHALSGYRHICEVAVCRWESSELAGARSEASFYQEVATRATNGLRRWSRVFSSGRAAAALWGGVVEWLRGRRVRARASWARALELARRHDMRLEQALAHYEIGRHLPVGDGRRRAHLRDACAIFSTLGARYDLGCAQRELVSHDERLRSAS
jgi:tetratricopeptide (TPR) repeat protein